jgi:hypothetical protein
MSETVDVVPALTKAVHDLDASRRVGWAKALDGAERIDDLERQLAMLQSELDTLRAAYIRLNGFVQNLQYERAPSWDAEVQRHDQAMRAYYTEHRGEGRTKTGLRRTYRAGSIAARNHHRYLRQLSAP